MLISALYGDRQLGKDTSFFQFHCRVKAIISLEDTTLLSLQAEPNFDADNHAKCVTGNAKASQQLFSELVILH